MMFSSLFTLFDCIYCNNAKPFDITFFVYRDFSLVKQKQHEVEVEEKKREDQLLKEAEEAAKPEIKAELQQPTKGKKSPK